MSPLTNLSVVVNKMYVLLGLRHLLNPIVRQLPTVPVILSLFDGIGAAKLALKRYAHNVLYNI